MEAKYAAFVQMVQRFPERELISMIHITATAISAPAQSPRINQTIKNNHSSSIPGAGMPALHQCMNFACGECFSNFYFLFKIFLKFL